MCAFNGSKPASPRWPATTPPACEAALTKARALELPADANPVDRMALLRIRALDVESTTDSSQLVERVKALQAEAHALVASPQVAPNRIMRLNLLLERVQKSLAFNASKLDAASRAVVMAQVDAIDGDVESIFQQALVAASKTDLHVYLTYADHRGSAASATAAWTWSLSLSNRRWRASRRCPPRRSCGHSMVAVEAALSDGNDSARFEKAAPHIKELLGSNLKRFQGLGHLFMGAIELEQSGVVGSPVKEGVEHAVAPASRPKLRTSALNHLKKAAEQLPDVVEAQARYGVALILTQELSLGRQYLQTAMRLGETEPQYQVWAAWSIVQAGYPEEAEPIVNHLNAEMARGQVPRELEGTLHLLSGEIHQARRSPEELGKALGDYERSYAGTGAPPAVQLRMAQIDVQLGHADRALQRIEKLRASGDGGTAAEHLAVLILPSNRNRRAKAAQESLKQARKRYPESEELVSLEAALLAKNEKAKEADQVLADYLKHDPDKVGVVLLRAQLLADLLDNPKDARRLLTDVADRTENSAPLVQLALLELKQKDYAAVSNAIAKIRARWKEAAAADLLEAQLSTFEQGNLSDALGPLRCQSAQERPGQQARPVLEGADRQQARRALEQKRRNAFESRPRGSTRARFRDSPHRRRATLALANLAAPEQRPRRSAIRRSQEPPQPAAPLLPGAGPGRSLAARRGLLRQGAVAARPQGDRGAPERSQTSPRQRRTCSRAANYYRLNKEEDAAIAQLDYVLKNAPGHPSAVVSRAYMLSEQSKSDQAIALIRNAIANPSKDKPPAVFYLMLAALENEAPPLPEASTRAMTALDQGLDVQPKAPELVQAKYKLLSVTKGAKAAVSYVESEAKDDPKGTMARMLAEVYREQKDYTKAEATLRDLVKKNPKEPGLAATLVRVVSIQAVLAGERNDRDRERAENEKAAALIKEYRAKFPGALAFVQEECDLAFRRGDVARATAITNEIDQLAKNSPVGPLLRARIYAAQGRTTEVAESYAEALRRNPAQPDVRLMLGQTRLKLGESDEAIRQAKLVLENDQDRAEALLLEARALAQPAGTESETAARRAQAIARLSSAIERRPRFTSAYHQLALIQMLIGQRPAAIATLRAALAAVPDDSAGLAQLVELLAGPLPPDGNPSAENLAAARSMASSVAERDSKGNLLIAIAVGFHKAGQLEPARDYAEKAAAKLDGAIVHLNYGDILLSIAERTKGDEAKPCFRRAVEQYDLVLSKQANSVEAVNNKAWILCKYLGESQKALELAQGLLSRVDPSTLPSEFFDTLGSIQEAVGRPRDAEDSYAKGLRKAPDHPVLNFHMGKLMVADARRSNMARPYLEKAIANRGRLSSSMASEADSLITKAR